MDSTMFLQIVLLTIATRSVIAWPITPLDGYSRVDYHAVTLECGGDNPEEFKGDPLTTVNITFVGNMTEGCYIKLRVSVKDIDIENYGMLVTGIVDINSENNGDGSISALTLEDEDDPNNDPFASVEKFYGKMNVSFHTREDILVIEMKIGSGGATGKGFQLTVEPVLICGGTINIDSSIKFPSYGPLYPNDYSCLWKVEAHEGFSTTLKCDKFDLRPPVKNKCKDFVEIFSSSKVEKYCGQQLKGDENSITLNERFLIIFRSDKRKNYKFTGFHCKINYIKNKKDLLMAKFFK